MYIYMSIYTITTITEPFLKILKRNVIKTQVGNSNLALTKNTTGPIWRMSLLNLWLHAAVIAHLQPDSERETVRDLGIQSTQDEVSAVQWRHCTTSVFLLFFFIDYRIKEVFEGLRWKQWGGLPMWRCNIIKILDFYLLRRVWHTTNTPHTPTLKNTHTHAHTLCLLSQPPTRSKAEIHSRRTGVHETELWKAPLWFSAGV